MRTYLILKQKAQRFAHDREIQALLQEIRAEDTRYEGPQARDGYTSERGRQLKLATFDVAALASRGRHAEQLDQLLMDLLLGVR